jgi:hypothetical protein
MLAGKDVEEEESANCFYKVLIMYGSLNNNGFDKWKTDHKLLQVWYSTFKSKNNTSMKKLNKLFRIFLKSIRTKDLLPGIPSWSGLSSTRLS